MSKKKHSPLPWELIGKQGTCIWSEANIIAMMHGSRDNHKLARANAAHIVKCVNNFDRLVEMVERLSERLDLANYAKIDVLPHLRGGNNFEIKNARDFLKEINEQ